MCVLIFNYIMQQLLIEKWLKFIHIFHILYVYMFEYTGWPKKMPPNFLLVISLNMHGISTNLVYLNLSLCMIYPQSFNNIYAIFQILCRIKKALKIVILWIEKWVYAYCMSGNILYGYSSLWLFSVFLLLWYFTSLKIYYFVSEICFMKCTQ